MSRRTNKRNRSKTEEKKVSDKTEEEIIAEVWRLSEPLCKAEGMELIYVEYQRESTGRILRLYIDHPGGVTLDDCVSIGRPLSDLLDVNLEDIGPYHLQISSPGPDRPLAKKPDFERFKGNVATIKTAKSHGGRKNFTGVLSGVSDEMVKLLIEGKTVAIPFQEITRARLVNYNGEN